MAEARARNRLEQWFVRVFAPSPFDDDGIHATSPVVVYRFVIVALLGLAVLLQPPDDAGALVAVISILALLLAAQPIIGHVASTHHAAWQRFFAVDLAASASVTLLVPDLATHQLVVTTGLIGAAATCYRVRGFFAYAAAAIAALAAVKIRSGAESPAQFTIVSGVVGVTFGLWMLRVRMIAESASRDLRQALAGARGISYVARIGDPRITVTGDLKGLLGLDPDEEGKIDLQELVHPDDLDEFWIPDDRLVEGREIDRTARFRTGDGRWKWIREFTRVVVRDDTVFLRGVMFDQTDDHDGLLAARAEATTDALTGLANRRVLVQLLDRTRVPGRHLVLFDLDSFKRINDTLGHGGGDELLRVVADRITASVRPADLVVRLGGDEFALVLEGLHETASAESLVDRILRSVAEPIDLNGVFVTTTSSAGIVREDDETSGSIEMLRRGDLAMYEAKSSSTRCAVFEKRMETDHERKSRLAADLEDAVHAGDLQLFFQPILDVDGVTVVGAEGLARWDHTDFGMLGPAEFLDVVLVSSQAGLFTQAMVRQALGLARQFQMSDRRIWIAVNLPIRTIEDPTFFTWFTEYCEITRTDPSLLVFEMSERELHDGAETSGAIARFADLGVTVAVDDFGTGHSTFDRLRWRNVDQLKIDRSLVQGAGRSERDRTILESVVTLADKLGYSVVAAGVETTDELDLVQRMGVDLVQGYLFAPALDSTDFVDFVLSRPREDVGHVAERV